VRAYFIALGLTAVILGLPLFFAGYVHIGCTVTTSGGNPVYSNCGGADDLVWGGGILVLAGLIFFGLSFVPNDQSRYK
jgi:hypothetical protein